MNRSSGVRKITYSCWLAGLLACWLAVWRAVLYLLLRNLISSFLLCTTNMRNDLIFSFQNKIRTTLFFNLLSLFYSVLSGLRVFACDILSHYYYSSYERIILAFIILLFPPVVITANYPVSPGNFNTGDVKKVHTKILAAHDKYLKAVEDGLVDPATFSVTNSSSGSGSDSSDAFPFPSSAANRNRRTAAAAATTSANAAAAVPTNNSTVNIDVNADANANVRGGEIENDIVSNTEDIIITPSGKRNVPAATDQHGSSTSTDISSGSGSDTGNSNSDITGDDITCIDNINRNNHSDGDDHSNTDTTTSSNNTSGDSTAGVHRNQGLLHRLAPVSQSSDSVNDPAVGCIPIPTIMSTVVSSL
jgi:hypothetical protein